MQVILLDKVANLITQATQVCYFIKQNNLHYLILSKSY